MAESQELQVQQKREVEKKTEGTTPGRAFVPVTDIFETPEALTVVLEMPGVGKNSIDIQIENNVLRVEGKPAIIGSSDAAFRGNGARW